MTIAKGCTGGEGLGDGLELGPGRGEFTVLPACGRVPRAGCGFILYLECLAGIAVGALGVAAAGAATDGVRWLLDQPQLRGSAAYVVAAFAWLGTPHGGPQIPEAIAAEFLSYLLSLALISAVGCSW